MFSLEDQIEIYTDEHFDASAAAQHFFASYGESEITKRLNDMSKVQQQIENVLKQNVRNKYTDFLLATEQINQVGQEMSELKALIDNTQKLVDDVRSARMAEPKIGRDNSMVRSYEATRPFEETKTESDRKTMNYADSIPSWLLKAVDDLSQLIVEKQYPKAVAIVVKTRSYVEGLEQLRTKAIGRSSSSSIANTTNEKATNILRQVNEKSRYLAQVIKSSLRNLPNSALWGMNEQIKRLKMLIALREYTIAVEGFAVMKQQTMQRALLSITNQNQDLLGYMHNLHCSFYQELSASIKLYQSLFQDSYQSSPQTTVLTAPQDQAMMTATLLVQWVQSQIAQYVLILSKQMTLSLLESSGNIIIYLRDVAMFNVRVFGNEGVPSGSSIYSTNGGSGGGVTPIFDETSSLSIYGTYEQTTIIPMTTNPLRKSILQKTSIAAATNIPDSPSSKPDDYYNDTNQQAQSLPKKPFGGLVLLAKGISIIYSYATQYNASQIAGASSNDDKRNITTIPIMALLNYYLMPAIRSMFMTYMDELLKEITSQVRQETWIYYEANSLVLAIRTNSQPTNNFAEESNRKNLSSSNTVSMSCIWMITALNHITENIWLLLNDTTTFSNENVRDDLTEIETVAMTCVLRFLLRYIMELEALDHSLFTMSQLKCFRDTLQAIMFYLLPSMQKLFENYFYEERVQLLPTHPTIIFKTISTRLFRIIGDVDVQLGNLTS